MILRDLNPFWRQLPVYSPVTLRSLWAGLAGVLRSGESLEDLHDLLLHEYGSDDLLLLDSGTSALRLAIRGALSNTDSAIVALPAYCCFDVATAAVGANARVALYDIRPESLGPDFDSLRAVLDTGARVVVVAHLYGLPVDLDRCRNLAAEHDAILIEDAAQGAGGAWRGQRLGSLGDLGILSFGRGKGQTGGGGGALLANSDRGSAVLNRVRDCSGPARGGLKTIAKLLAQWALGRPSMYGIPASLPFLGLGETRYRDPWEPRGMEIGSAASLLENWEASDRESACRKQGDEWFPARLAEFSGLMVPSEPAGGVAGWLRLPAVVAAISDDAARTRASRTGLARGYPLPLSALPVLTERRVIGTDTPGASSLAEFLWTLPTHSRSVPGETILALTDLIQSG